MWEAMTETHSTKKLYNIVQSFIQCTWKNRASHSGLLITF